LYELKLWWHGVYGIYMRFLCLDYPLDVSISWIQSLSLYNWFCPLLYLIYYLMSYPMLLCTYAHNTHAFFTRIYRYTCASLIPDFPLISWFSFMFLVNAYTCLPESYHLILYTWTWLCTPLGIHLTTHWGVLTPLDLHVRFQSLKLVDFSSYWSEMRSGSVDHRQIVWGPILPGPLLGSRVSFFDSW